MSARAQVQTPARDFAGLKEAHRREKRRHLEAAAARVFAQKGFRQATVADVARAAGVSSGAIYLYFSSREELLFATVLAEIDDLEARMRAVLADPAPADAALRAMMDAYLAFWQERPQGFGMLMAGLEREARAKADPELVAAYDRRALGCLALVRDVVVRGMDQGTLRPGDPTEVADAVWSACHGVLQLATSGGEQRFLGRDVQRLFAATGDALLDGVRA